MQGEPFMFAASLVVVALLAGVLLWIFVRQSPRFAGFARSAPAAEPLPGRTRRAGEGLVYHPPADPDPMPVLAPAPPLGLSPGVDAEPDEPEPPEADDAAFASVTWDAGDDALDEEDEEEAEAPLSSAPAPVETPFDPGEPSSAAPFVPAEPQPTPLAAPRMRTPSSALGLTPYDASEAAEDDEADDGDPVPPAWQPEPTPAVERSEVPPAPIALSAEPAAPIEAPAFDWTQVASLRLQELGVLVASGGFAAYFTEVTSPHAWDEMIEALRAIGAPEAAEIATAAGEAQWPYHEQGALAPREDFAEADAQWAMLDPDLLALLDAWLAEQAERGAARDGA